MDIGPDQGRELIDVSAAPVSFHCVSGWFGGGRHLHISGSSFLVPREVGLGGGISDGEFWIRDFFLFLGRLILSGQFKCTGDGQVSSLSLPLAES